LFSALRSPRFVYCFLHRSRAAIEQDKSSSIGLRSATVGAPERPLGLRFASVGANRVPLARSTVQRRGIRRMYTQACSPGSLLTRKSPPGGHIVNTITHPAGFVIAFLIILCFVSARFAYTLPVKAPSVF